MNDERCHLFGTTRILNSIASFAADGGLRESASWISLRQHIYISLTSQRPLTINLTTFRDSQVFQTSDDESWANRIIFIFARILIHVFRPGAERLSMETWEELNSEVSDWNLLKPWHFSPLFLEGSSTSTAPPDQSHWPELLVCNEAQGNDLIFRQVFVLLISLRLVVGLQHYHLAQIVLAIYDPRLLRLGFGSFRTRRASEVRSPT